jgi:hypothetical protein
MSGLRIVLKRLVRRWHDPFLIDRDWYEFKAMTDDELRAEYERLLTHEPRSDRFRRLCQCISSRWVYAPNSAICVNEANDKAQF